jgi:hypothetical protein
MLQISQHDVKRVPIWGYFAPPKRRLSKSEAT